jgi:hypothetical protein
MIYLRLINLLINFLIHTDTVRPFRDETRCKVGTERKVWYKLSTFVCHDVVRSIMLRLESRVP